MMFDLNVGIVSDDSSSWSDSKVLVMAVEEEEEEVELIGAGGGGGKGREEKEEGEEHSSGTSDSSSVVNDDEFPVNAGDENSSRAGAAAASAFVFDVFDKANEEGARSELVTQQLFPVPSGGAAEHGPRPATPAATLMTQWLDLSFTGGGGGESGGGQLLAGELRSFQPQKKQQARKSRRGPRSRSSQYRGVTFYRRTGRWESHIWDCGKQLYLGGFDTAYAAARAYDRAAIKFRGVDADINFSASEYEEDMRQMGNLTKEEFVHVLRRQSTGGFPRSSSKYRAMGLPKCGRWEARTGQFLGKKANENSVARPRGVTGLGYDLGTVAEATGQGTGGHDLDLNLGMAPPSVGDLVKIEAAGYYHGRGSRIVDSPSNVSAPKKLIPVWPATYHFLLPSSEGKAVGRTRAEVPASPNIGRQMANNGNYGGTSASPATLPRVLSDKAASSGFSSSCSSSNSFYLYK